jgi:hypothetical protein
MTPPADAPEPAAPKKLRRFKLDDISEILSLFKRLTEVEGYQVWEAHKILATQFDRTPATILNLLKRFRPTTKTAQSYMEAQALKLAMRVVRNADVDQAIDVLSRPNLAVLAPAKEIASGPQGFFLSVQAENLGAVRLATGAVQGELAAPQMMTLQSPQEGLQAPSGASSALPEVLEVVPEAPKRLKAAKGPHMEKGNPHPNQGTFRKTGLTIYQQQAIARAKKKHKAALKHARHVRNRAVLTGGKPGLS